jgi:thiopeptide-type bacteriocin biosynthesis protein
MNPDFNLSSEIEELERRRARLQLEHISASGDRRRNEQPDGMGSGPFVLLLRHAQAVATTLIEAPRSHEMILERAVTPWRSFRDADRSVAVLRVRYSEPTWQLRFRVLGDPAWVEGVARPQVRAALRPLLDEGLVTALHEAKYDRELERYGGPLGMRLAERVFHLDSLAALDWMTLERAGRTQWRRREFSLLLAARIADLFGSRTRRPFHRQGTTGRSTKGSGTKPRARPRRRARTNRAGLAALLDAGPPLAPANARCCDPPGAAAGDALREGLADGSVRAHAPYLAWSLAHMSTNRLGIDPAAEAILRYLVGHREAG